MIKKINKLEKYSKLAAETASINARGNPTGKRETMLTSDGLVVGSNGSREKACKVALATLNSLLPEHHYVLQSSEGKGIKIVGQDGNARAVVTSAAKDFTIYCIKCNKDEAKSKLDKLGIKGNIRSSAKNENVYVDFDTDTDHLMVKKFISGLTPGNACRCGHKNDTAKASKTGKIKTEKGNVLKKSKNATPEQEGRSKIIELKSKKNKVPAKKGVLFQDTPVKIKKSNKSKK